MMREPLPDDCIDAPDVTHHVPDIVPRHHPVAMHGRVAHWPVVAAELAGPRPIAHYLEAMDSGTPTMLFSTSPILKGHFFYSDDTRGLNFTSHKVP